MSRADVPYDITAEASLLGAMLIDTKIVHDAIELGVTADAFYKPGHQHIFAVLADMYIAHQPIDPVTVADRLNRDGLLADLGGVAYLNELTVVMPSTGHAHHYAAIVLGKRFSRRMIELGAQLAALGYEDGDEASRTLAEAQSALTALADETDLRMMRGYYDDIGLLDPGTDRDDQQPWIHRGVLRRNQRALIVARAGIGKSTLLRQLAACCANGIHPYTGQPTEVPREALIVELEAGEWDISSSMRIINFALQNALGHQSVWDVNRPALLHRPGGLDLRTPAGYATLEGAIRRAEPDLVVLGPLKYLSVSKPGENYEIAALNLMAILNQLMERYSFGLVIEAHFSRGDHGAPGGSERWVDWPDVGFGIHPGSDDITARLFPGAALEVKQFRIPRDSAIWVPNAFVRGAANALPWSVQDYPDPYRAHATIYSSRYGGSPAESYSRYEQGEF